MISLGTPRTAIKRNKLDKDYLGVSGCKFKFGTPHVIRLALAGSLTIQISRPIASNADNCRLKSSSASPALLGCHDGNIRKISGGDIKQVSAVFIMMLQIVMTNTVYGQQSRNSPVNV